MDMQEALNIVITAAEVRRDQWQHGADTADAVDMHNSMAEVYADRDDSQCMADLLTVAIDTVQAQRRTDSAQFFDRATLAAQEPQP